MKLESVLIMAEHFVKESYRQLGWGITTKIGTSETPNGKEVKALILDECVHLYPETFEHTTKTIAGDRIKTVHGWAIDIIIEHSGGYWNPPEADLVRVNEQFHNIYDAMLYIFTQELQDRLTGYFRGHEYDMRKIEGGKL